MRRVFIHIVKAEDEEKDLGIIVAQNLKSSSQCVAPAKSANQTLGMISRKDKEVMMRLYQTLVRPKLEYCVQAWRPYLKKDIDLLEKVQKRATRLIINDRGLTYRERLKKLGLTTLETRLRGDMNDVFKILTVLMMLKLPIFSLCQVLDLEGMNLNCIYKPQTHLDIRKNFLQSYRVIDEWNRLPETVLPCNTLSTCKRKLDCFLKNRGYD